MARSAANLLAAALLLAAGTGCGAVDEAESPTPQPVEREIELIGFEGPNRILMERLTQGLDPSWPIRSASSEPTPPDRQGRPVEDGERWVTMRVEYSADHVERERADWAAMMLLAALWREARADPEAADIFGGETLFVRADGESREPGADGYMFATNADEYLFTDGRGGPATLSADETGLKERLAAFAQRANFTIERLAFSGVLGTAVELDVTADDPIDFIENRTPLLLQLREALADLEGWFLVIRDPEGDLVHTRSRLVGLSRGTRGYDSKYGDFDRGAER